MAGSVCFDIHSHGHDCYDLIGTFLPAVFVLYIYQTVVAMNASRPHTMHTFEGREFRLFARPYEMHTRAHAYRCMSM